MGRATQWITLTRVCNAQGICEPIGEGIPEETPDPDLWENEIVFLESLLIATDIALGMLQGCLPDLYTQTAERLITYRVDIDFPRYPPNIIAVFGTPDVETLDTTLRDVEELLQWYMSHPQNIAQPADIWHIRNDFDSYAEPIPPEPGDDPVEDTQVLGVYLNSCVEERTRQQLIPATDIVRRGLELIDHWSLAPELIDPWSLAPPETPDVFYLVRDVCWLMASYMRPDLPWSTVVPRAWRTEEEAKEAAVALQKAFDIWWQDVKNVLPMRDLPEMETLL